jgi:hypothetical protein
MVENSRVFICPTDNLFTRILRSKPEQITHKSFGELDNFDPFVLTIAFRARHVSSYGRNTAIP